MRKLVLASQNKGKILELQEMLAGLPLEVVGLEQYPDLPEIEETGTTFIENATLKAKTTAKIIGELTLADDSGLEVDALGGEPGIYSARYGRPGWSDQQRYQYLLEKLIDVPDPKRTAAFRSAVALYDPATDQLEVVEGSVAGIILTQPKGDNGFGYDPIFFVPELGKTMAELADVEKNQISHRARAVTKIIPRISKLLG